MKTNFRSLSLLLNNSFFISLLLISSYGMANEMPTRYVKDIQKISDQYSADMKTFLKSLDPNTTQFESAQQAQFCAILQRYADQFHLTNQKHRKNLPLSYTVLTKREIVAQVSNAKEWQMLKQYGVQCQLNDQD
jgi:hypothetical protein